MFAPACTSTVLVAEIIKHFLPRMIEIHNYVSAMSVNQKMNNWATLNRYAYYTL